ncbi:MAG: hypothetical protein A2Z95_06180 [Gallionellales bacterium GWA2_60_18]|nr:MAG: hypothetical protein A2Z95_06180 [Gallionellales bacterium GWA2_60_18]
MENTTETAPAKPEQNEIATTRDGRDITRGFVDGMPLLPTTDKLLMLKSGGDLRIYQEVMRDEQVKACFEQRVRAVVSKPWEVRPGGKKLADKKAAEFIDEQLKAIRFDSITEKMLYGVFYGYGVAEAMYAVEDGKVVLDTSRGGIKVRDRRRFAFAPDMSLRLRTSSNPMGEILPEKKFWHFATGSDHDDEPYGLGLAHWLYWPVFFKRSGVKFWLIFLEKFGMPTAVGKYQPGTSPTDQDKLLEALQAIQTDSAIIFPEGMTAELLEATRGGTADYTALYDRMDAAIARATLGQTASTQGTPGRLGNDDLQSDVRDDIVRADADLVCMSFNATVVKWLVEWNFPGAALPQVWRKFEDEEDANQTAERDERICGMGFKPSLRYVHDTYGGEWVERAATPDVALPSPAGGRGGEGEGAQFAELRPDVFDSFAEELAGDWERVTDPLVAPIVALAAESASFEDFQARLPELIQGMDAGKLAESLAQGQFATRLWGRLSGAN